MCKNLLFILFLSPVYMFGLKTIDFQAVLGEVERELGKLPADSRPGSFLNDERYSIRAESFYREAPKIVNLLDLLNEKSTVPACKTCLNEINNMLYLKGFHFLETFLVDELSQGASCAKKEQASLITECLETLHVLCHNPDTAPVMTRLLIDVFKVQADTKLSVSQKILLLTESLATYKVKLVGDGISAQRIDAFIQEFRLLVLKSLIPVSWWEKLSASYVVVGCSVVLSVIIIGAVMLKMSSTWVPIVQGLTPAINKMARDGVRVGFGLGGVATEK